MTQDVEDCNEVRLVGRVSTEPVAKQLPSGDTVWVFRLVVRRPEGHGSRQGVDVLECSVWGARLQASQASRSRRVTSPGRGLGWNDVAFSGSRRPGRTTASTSSRVGAGSSSARAPRRRASSIASSASWW